MTRKMNNSTTTTSGTPSNQRINPGIMIFLLVYSAGDDGQQTLILSHLAISLPSTVAAHDYGTREPAVGKHGGNSQIWVKQIDAGLSHFELTLNLREGERRVPCAVPSHRGPREALRLPSSNSVLENFRELMGSES